MSQFGNANYHLERTILPLSTGVSLEVDLLKPTPGAANDSRKLAICLHPWSWLGGQKDDPILGSLTDPLLEANYHILRYNSRSVGKSTGWSSFTGFSEVEDMKALVQWALNQIENVISLVLVGYSHGSLIASLHPVLPPPIQTSHVLLSYPLGTRGWLTLFKSSYYQGQLEDLLKNPRSNVLVIYGNSDEFTSISSYKGWVEKLENAARGRGHLSIDEIEGASHFWHGQNWLKLKLALSRWLP